MVGAHSAGSVSIRIGFLLHLQDVTTGPYSEVDWDQVEAICHALVAHGLTASAMQVLLVC